eukprot:s2857_g10.t1
MRVSLCLAFAAFAAAQPAQPELLRQVEELQQELSQQRQLIQELKETRRLQAEKSETQRIFLPEAFLGFACGLFCTTHM